MTASADSTLPRWKDNPYLKPLGDRDAVQALADTPITYRGLVALLTPAQFETSYAPGKWTAAQLFLHLAQTELAFCVRLRMALTTDAYVVQPFDQDKWMSREPVLAGPEAFASYFALRQFNLELYRSVTPDESARTFQHPERGPMKIGWLLEFLAGHELHHLAHMEAIARSGR